MWSFNMNSKLIHRGHWQGFKFIDHDKGIHITGACVGAHERSLSNAFVVVCSNDAGNWEIS